METAIKEEEHPVHTEQIQEIIGAPPRWLYKWGITLVLGVTLFCTACTLFIRYPEEVNAKLKIMSTLPLQAISFKDSARLFKILVQNNQKVKKGQILAIGKNAVNEIALKAPGDGELHFVGIVHENEQLKPDQIIFTIVPYEESFYGALPLSEFAANRVKKGQIVLVKFKGSSGGGPDVLQGKIIYIADNFPKTNEHIAEVDFPRANNKYQADMLHLRNGVIADAEIIIAPSTLFQRIIQSLMKGIK